MKLHEKYKPRQSDLDLICEKFNNPDIKDILEKVCPPGTPIKKAARELGIYPSTLKRWLIHYGVEIIPILPGRLTPGKTIKSKFYNAYKNGKSKNMTVQEAADGIGTSYIYAYQLLNNLNLPYKTNGGDKKTAGKNCISFKI